MAGYDIDTSSSAVFDHFRADLSPFYHTHEPVANAKRYIKIGVHPASFLKYLAMCVSRTAGQDLRLEDLDVDTHNKLRSHPIMRWFIPDLDHISAGPVTAAKLRDWARLCFFADHGRTIQGFIKVSTDVDAAYNIDFESFYDGSVIDWCVETLKDLGLDADPDRAQTLLDSFKYNNRYFLIDKPVQAVLQSIKDRADVDIPELNWLQEGYIDACLQQEFGVEPMDLAQYWSHTRDLYLAYGIK